MLFTDHLSQNSSEFYCVQVTGSSKSHADVIIFPVMLVPFSFAFLIF